MDVGRGFLICNVRVRILKLLCRMTLGKRVLSKAEHEYIPRVHFRSRNVCFTAIREVYYLLYITATSTGYYSI